MGSWNFPVWILLAFENAKISQFWRFSKIDDFQNIRKIRQIVFFQYFLLFQWILELVLRVDGKMEPFFSPKSVFFYGMNFAGESRLLISSIFFFKMAKKGSEKLKCNDLFFFYSILPPKKWGKTIESLLTFPKVENSGLLTCVHL